MVHIKRFKPLTLYSIRGIINIPLVSIHLILSDLEINNPKIQDERLKELASKQLVKLFPGITEREAIKVIKMYYKDN